MAHKDLRKVSLLAMGALVVLLGTTTLAPAAPYGPGDEWNRLTDWTPGSTVGSSTGNPDDDWNDNPTWSYEWVTGGGGLGSANPWYLQPGTRMVWEQVLTNYPGWYAPRPGNWKAGMAVTNFTGAPLNVEHPGMVNHVAYDAGYWAKVPLLRWTNPTGEDLIVTLLGPEDGEVTLRWGVANSTHKVDYIIAKADAAGNIITPLLLSVTKSVPPGSDTDITLPVSLLNVPVGAGEQIIITHRLDGYGPREWLSMTTPDILLQVVPEPGTLTLLALAGGLVLRRRSRRG